MIAPKQNMTVKRKDIAKDKAGAHPISNFGFGGASHEDENHQGLNNTSENEDILDHSPSEEQMHGFE